MKIQGLWLQSVGLMLFVGDVHLAHDSSLTVEASHFSSCPCSLAFLRLTQGSKARREGREETNVKGQMQHQPFVFAFCV